MQQILRAVVLSIMEALKMIWERRVDFVYTLFLEKLLRPNSALRGFRNAVSSPLGVTGAEMIDVNKLKASYSVDYNCHCVVI